MLGRGCGGRVGGPKASPVGFGVGGSGGSGKLWSESRWNRNRICKIKWEMQQEKLLYCF